MSKETDSFNLWCESEEGKNSLNASTIGITKDNAQYLQNRIWRAYMSGLASGRRIERGELQERAARALFGS